MQPTQRTLLRAAEAIRSRLCQAAETSSVIEFHEANSNECQKLVRQFELAAERGWRHAQALVRERLERSISDCVDHLQRSLRYSVASREIAVHPSCRSIYEELSSLLEEFDGVAIDLRAETLSVTSERVVLEDIDLGPFEIRLRWDRIGERRPYEVVALDPNPARESSDVNHPHVRGEQLCEGEGRTAIERALRAARLVDFFQIVIQILGTYNAGSAYVSLSAWDGASCSDCGAVVTGDDLSSCDRCNGILCLDCQSACARCDDWLCHSCLAPCRDCESPLCHNCQKPCADCDRTFCDDCLTENGLCHESQEEHNVQANEEEHQSFEIAETDAAAAGISSPLPKQDATAV